MWIVDHAERENDKHFLLNCRRLEEVSKRAIELQRPRKEEGATQDVETEEALLAVGAVRSYYREKRTVS